LILETPTGQKVTFQKLTADSAKEASFRMLRVDCRDEIIHAHGVPPQKVGIVETGKLGGNLASEQIKEYKDSIIAPGREMVCEQLDRIIQAFGTDKLTLNFADYDIEDRVANSKIDAAYLDRNVLTPNEVRANRFPDLEPLEGQDQPLKPATLGDVALIDESLQQLQRIIREQGGQQ
jgi:hypothetical protein